MRGRVLMSDRRVGLQVAAVAAVYGGIELPCGGQREAGHLAARILRRLVAGDLDDAETTAFCGRTCRWSPDRRTIWCPG